MINAAKKILLAAGAAAAVLLPVDGAERTAVFSRVKIDIRLEKPPVPSVSNTPRPAQRHSVVPQWLVVRTTFRPLVPTGGVNQNTFYDAVKMRIRMLFPLGRSADSLGMFGGEQTFWTVCCDGKTHTAIMLVPPQLLQRYPYMADGYPSGHTLQRSTIRVEVVFTDRTGRELGRGYCNVSGNSAKQVENFQRMAGGVPQEFVIDGAILPREATPWICMAPEQFELAVPAGVKVPEVPIPVRNGNFVRVNTGVSVSL